jgi:hypothetical protein
MLSPLQERARSTDQSPDDEKSLALQLSDAQLSDVMRLATPLALHCRDALLRILAYQLRGRRDVGDGELHRIAREIISTNHLFDPPLEAERHAGKYA